MELCVNSFRWFKSVQGQQSSSNHLAFTLHAMNLLLVHFAECWLIENILKNQVILYTYDTIETSKQNGKKTN